MKQTDGRSDRQTGQKQMDRHRHRKQFDRIPSSTDEQTNGRTDRHIDKQFDRNSSYSQISFSLSSKSGWLKVTTHDTVFLMKVNEVGRQIDRKKTQTDRQIDRKVNKQTDGKKFWKLLTYVIESLLKVRMIESHMTHNSVLLVETNEADWTRKHLCFTVIHTTVNSHVYLSKNNVTWNWCAN